MRYYELTNFIIVKSTGFEMITRLWISNILRDTQWTSYFQWMKLDEKGNMHETSIDEKSYTNEYCYTFIDLG